MCGERAGAEQVDFRRGPRFTYASLALQAAMAGQGVALAAKSSAGDDLAAPRVAIVDETLARRYWPDADPVGRRTWRGRGADDRTPERAIRVVGVARAIKRQSLTDADTEALFDCATRSSVPGGSGMRHSKGWPKSGQFSQQRRTPDQRSPANARSILSRRDRPTSFDPLAAMARNRGSLSYSARAARRQFVDQTLDAHTSCLR